MQEGTKGKCASTSHRRMMDNAKNRLNDLQGRFSELQAARKEGRANDVASLEEKVHQSLLEWKDELNAPSPATSLFDDGLGSFSDDIGRMLQLFEEEDDATSPLAIQLILKPEPGPEPGPEPNVQSLNHGELTSFPDMVMTDNVNRTHSSEDYFLNYDIQGHEFQGFDQPTGFHETSNPDISTYFDIHRFTLDEGFNCDLPVDTSNVKEPGQNSENGMMSYVSPPPAAFMGPKCSLWECTRPSRGSEWFEDYCSSFHATVALKEGAPGMTPVLRPKGIGLKDNLLFAALTGKALHKNVGIPHCEGAASTKSPWNATELFDIFLLEGETIREWLFFDKPRRAFDIGNRKQRSLPDHRGRGWHESRKQVIKEFGGHKKSYYMDPQPLGFHEWHLYEYEITNHIECALYKLELKLTDGKKTQKGKVTKDPLADLQKKMGRLTAEVSADSSPSSDKGKIKTMKKTDAEEANSAQDEMTSIAGSLG